MMLKRYLPRTMNIFITLLVFTIFLSTTTDAYDKIYGDDGTGYVDDLGVNGTWKTTTPPSIYSKTVTDAINAPLSSDLDGDNITEIIVTAKNQIYIYQNFTLDLAASLPLSNITTTGVSSYVYSSLYTYIYDVDGDSNKEIIIASMGNDTITVYNYSSGTAAYQTSFKLPAKHRRYLEKDIMIACRDTQDCLAVYTPSVASQTSGWINVTGTFFNESGTYNYTNLLSVSGPSGIIGCFSQIPVLDVKDIDSPTTGAKEYIYSLHESIPGNDASLYVQAITVSSDGFVSSKWVTTSTDYRQQHENNCITGGIGRWLSSPLAYISDGDTSSGMEIAVAASVGTEQDFNMKIFSNSGVLIDTSPDTFEADGKIISNPFLAYAVPAEDIGMPSSVCVMGSDSDGLTFDSRMTVLCHSEVAVGGIITEDDYQFYIDDFAGYFNLSFNRGMWSPFTTSGQAGDYTSGSLEDGVVIAGYEYEPSEFITPYGIYYIEGDDSDLLGVGEFGYRLVSLYSRPSSITKEGVIIPVLTDASGKYDLLYQTNDTIYYIDDRFVNSPAYIRLSETTTNPCITQTIKNGSQFDVSVTVYDPNSDLGDKVQSKVVLYYGTTNRFETEWSSPITSGQTQIHSFTLNRTGNVVMKLHGRDATTRTEINDTETLSFSVGISGVEWGDSICAIGADPVNESQADELDSLYDDEDADNAVNTALFELSGITGMSRQFIYFFLLTIVMVGTFLFMHSSPQVAIMAVVTELIGGIIIGGMLGVVSTYIIIILAFLAIIGGVLTMASLFMNAGGG